ncbi:MAG: hypothetical protein R2828_03185 [Saprospiraceae bacterium]
MSNSIEEVKVEIMSNYCNENTLAKKDEFYDCSLSKKMIRGLNASKVFSCLEDFYYDDLLKTEVGEFSILLTAYGYRGRSDRSREKRKKHLESDFNSLRSQFDQEFSVIDYSFREEGESGEREEIIYGIVENDRTNSFRLSKIRGGCFNQAMIYFHIEKANDRL